MPSRIPPRTLACLRAIDAEIAALARRRAEILTALAEGQGHDLSASAGVRDLDLARGEYEVAREDAP